MTKKYKTAATWIVSKEDEGHEKAMKQSNKVKFLKIIFNEKRKDMTKNGVNVGVIQVALSCSFSCAHLFNLRGCTLFSMCKSVCVVPSSHLRFYVFCAILRR